MQLSNVFAVEVRPGFYIPRSKASLTETMPMLWVNRNDAERATRKHECNGHSPRVVEFKIVPAEPPAPSSSPVQQPDAGDAVLREFMEWAKDGSQDGHLDSGLLALNELARRALAERPPATDATGEPQ